LTLSGREKDAFPPGRVLIRRAAFSPDVTGLARQLIGDWYRDHLDASRVTEYTQRTLPAISEAIPPCSAC
jgi:hypothetical protein